MDKQLLPCPFCGGENLTAGIVGEDGEIAIWCDCGCTIHCESDECPELTDETKEDGTFDPLSEGLEPLRKTWNTRPPQNSGAPDIEELAKVIYLSENFNRKDDDWIAQGSDRAIYRQQARYILSKLATPQPNDSELSEALELILPLAKGYAAEHPVGSNQEYVNQAEVISKAFKEGKLGRGTTS